MTVTVDAQRQAPNHPLGSEAQATPHYQAELIAAASPTPTHQAHEAATVPVILDHTGTYSRTLARGEPLYLQGEAAESTYVIEAGLVALSLNSQPDRERIIALAGPGDLVGALTTGQGEYLESAHALSHDVAVRAVHVSQPGGDSASTGPAPAPEVSAAMSRAAGEHLARLTHLLEDSDAPVPARVARTLLRLGERFGHGLEAGGREGRVTRRVRITLPLTHETIASMVGAARETTTSTIEQMRRSGLVHGTRGRYVIDVDGLSDFVDQSAIS